MLPTAPSRTTHLWSRCLSRYRMLQSCATFCSCSETYFQSSHLLDKVGCEQMFMCHWTSHQLKWSQYSWEWQLALSWTAPLLALLTLVTTSFSFSLCSKLVCCTQMLAGPALKQLWGDTVLEYEWMNIMDQLNQTPGSYLLLSAHYLTKNRIGCTVCQELFDWNLLGCVCVCVSVYVCVCVSRCCCQWVKPQSHSMWHPMLLARWPHTCWATTHTSTGW